jgi:hypothetical protein
MIRIIACLVLFTAAMYAIGHAVVPWVFNIIGARSAVS